MSLSSEASSDVLFSLILGRVNPKAIAEHTGDSPASVVEQLNKLRAEAYVKRGEKDGKYQLYEVHWDKVISDAIRVAPLLIDGLVVLNNSGQGDESDRRIASLMQNGQLHSFIRCFVEAVARRETEADVYSTYHYREGGGSPLKGPRRTFSAVMRDFEYGLLSTFSDFERSGFATAGKTELYDGLRVWHDLCEIALRDLVAKPFADQIRETIS